MTVDRRFATSVAVLREIRDPALLFGAPIAFALLVVLAGPASGWPIGFDFRGTLWDPARALLDGTSIYPAPSREAIVVGNPAVYPPFVVLLTLPLAFLSAGAAALVWAVLLVSGVVGALWMLGVRDWRCVVLAVASPVVVQGVYFGNLTILLVLLVALAWRYRDRAPVAGLAVGAAVAAKLFLLPLVVWLVVTRRFAAAAWSVGAAVGLALGAWALIGFQGLEDYPALLRVVQDVYATHSYSLGTVAVALGAPSATAPAAGALAGVAMIGVAACLAGRAEADRRVFALVVGACIVASPIVWPNYAALLIVPVAVTWPTLAPAGVFGYAFGVAEAIAPSPLAVDAGEPPPGVPEQAWLASHTEPFLWYGAGFVATVIGITALVACSHRGNVPREATSRDTATRPMSRGVPGLRGRRA